MAGPRATDIVVRFEGDIRAGRLRPGDALPPVRTLAERLAVSPGTVAAAYRTLRLRGLVGGQGRHGTRVTARPPVALRALDTAPQGLRDLATGNPDPTLLPRLPPVRLPPSPLYGSGAHVPELLRQARHALAADGIPAEHLAVMGGALDAIERVLQAHLRAGDRVAVEDPGYPGVLDL